MCRTVEKSQPLGAMDMNYKKFASHSPTLTFPMWFLHVSSFLPSSADLRKPPTLKILFLIVVTFLMKLKTNHSTECKKLSSISRG